MFPWIRTLRTFQAPRAQIRHRYNYTTSYAAINYRNIVNSRGNTYPGIEFSYQHQQQSLKHRNCYSSATDCTRYHPTTNWLQEQQHDTLVKNQNTTTTTTTHFYEQFQEHQVDQRQEDHQKTKTYRDSYPRLLHLTHNSPRNQPTTQVSDNRQPFTKKTRTTTTTTTTLTIQPETIPNKWNKTTTYPQAKRTTTTTHLPDPNAPDGTPP